MTGVAPALLLLVPPLQIFLNLSPVDLDVPVTTWALYYAGFYVMQILVALFTMGSFRWETLILSAASFPIYLRALWNALVGETRRARQRTVRVAAARRTRSSSRSSSCSSSWR